VVNKKKEKDDKLTAGVSCVRWFMILLIILSTFAISDDIDRVFVAVLGDNDEVYELEQKLNGIVSGFLSKDYKEIFLENLKNCQMGFSECPAFKKFPFVDFAIFVGKPVKIYCFEKNFVEVPPSYISQDLNAIVDYFEQFILYHHLPRFEDPQAKKGDVYILMDENFNDIKKCTIEKRSEIVDLSRCAPKGVKYARKQRRTIKFRGYEKEIRKSDISNIWIGAKRFEVYEDGQIVKIPVRVSHGGVLIIIDVYNDAAFVISSEAVESGKTIYEFQAYYDPSARVEELVFVLLEPSEDIRIPVVGKELSEEEFKDLVESAKGISAFMFTVAKY
jgi:hypothetical protein